MKTRATRTRSVGDGVRRIRQSGWALPVVALLAGVPQGAAASAQEGRVCDGNRCVIVQTGELFDMRPRLGVYLSASPDREDGVRIRDVTEGGPAERAGIETGDVIVRFAGHALAEPLPEEAQRRAWSAERRLRALLAETGEGDTVEVEVERHGETLTFMVSPERLPWSAWPSLSALTIDSLALDSLQHRMRRMTERIRMDAGDMRDLTGNVREIIDRTADVRRPDAWVGVFGSFPGLDLVDLNPGLGAYFGTDEGVLVADIAADSPLGLRPGDVVVDVEGRRVDDAAELRRILASYRIEEEIVFAIWRDGESLTVTGRREAPPPSPSRARRRP